MSAAVPLPGALPAVHISLCAASHLVASSSWEGGCVQLWDARLLPAPPGGQPLPGAPQLGGAAGALAAWEELSTAGRRALAATLELPSGFRCARQLHLDGAKGILFAALDDDPTASAFSRAASHLALFDVRAAHGAAAAPAAGRGGWAPPPPLWQRRVRGGLSCFQCSGDRLLLGSCAGQVLLWRQFGGLAPLPEPDEEPIERRKLRTADKKKTNPKVRGRFPKTQGFSNTKGFGNVR